MTEIAAVGVLASHRGLGVAGAVIGRLASSALEARAELIWLTTENQPEQNAAMAAGLTSTGAEMLHIFLPAPA